VEKSVLLLLTGFGDWEFVVFGWQLEGEFREKLVLGFGDGRALPHLA
jgi:hypothetical protein